MNAATSMSLPKKYLLLPSDRTHSRATCPHQCGPTHLFVLIGETEKQEMRIQHVVAAPHEEESGIRSDERLSGIGWGANPFDDDPNMADATILVEMDSDLQRKHLKKSTSDQHDSKEESKENSAQATLDDVWFQNVLQTLPTLFRVPGIFDISSCRLRSLLKILNEVLAVPGAVSSTNPEAVLVLDEENDRMRVLTVMGKVKDQTALGSTSRFSPEGVKTITSRATLTGTSQRAANARVVMDWLLDSEHKAEADARQLAHAYPYSFVAWANLFYILWITGDRQGALSVLTPMWQIRKIKANLYNLMMDEANGELGCCLTELGPQFIPQAVSLLQSVIARHSVWYQNRWNLARNLRRSFRQNRQLQNSCVRDPDADLVKAFQLHYDLLRVGKTTGRHDLAASAASELGEILHACEFYSRSKGEEECVRKANHVNLTAAKCFDIVMSVQKPSPSCLVRAGKYYRYTRNYPKSLSVLKQAVKLQPSAKAHHQLALIHNKLAWQQKGGRGKPHGTGRAITPRPDMRMVVLEIQLKLRPVGSRQLQREDKHVKEMIDHLNMALRVSEGECTPVSYDLGLAYQSLGEYQNALEQFIDIIDQDNVFTDHDRVCQAFEQCGIVFLKKIYCDFDRFQVKAHTVFTMAILYQARMIMDWKNSSGSYLSPVWKRLRSVRNYLRKGFDYQSEKVDHVEKYGENQAELWLLRLMWRYALNLPALISVKKVSNKKARNMDYITEEMRQAIEDERFQDAILLAYICRLLPTRSPTGKCTFLRSRGFEDEIDDRVTKAHVLAAKARLKEDIEEKNTSVQRVTLNQCMARRFFRWAFQDRFPVANYSSAEIDDLNNQNVDEDPLKMSESPKFDVAVIHEQDDQRAARAARVLSNVLQQVCGLKTRWTGGEVHSLEDTHQENLKAVDTARVVVFILSRTGMSPEFEKSIQRAVSRQAASTFPSVAAFTIQPCSSLPALFKKCRSFPWEPALEGALGWSTRSPDWLKAVRRVFCFIADLRKSR